MVTKVDERNGIVRTYWKEVRQRVMKVNPEFAKIVDELAPDETFPLFLAYYPYGALKGDTQSTFIPLPNNEFRRLTDPSLPKDIIKNLGYGKDSSPFGMVLEKQFELHIDFTDEKNTIPWMIYTPGSFFASARNLSRKSKRVYAPNGVLTKTAGARSTFMLPNIGCATNHAYLQRGFNIQTPPPKSMYEHWPLFKEIINSGIIECDWMSCILFFSENWIKAIYNDKAWVNLKLFLHELAWNQFAYDISRIFYDITFSIIQRKRNLKPNPYLVDTARHLLATAAGASPGFAPACNSDAIPLDILQKVFVENYGLKRYLPTIMQPTYFHYESSILPVYYSLQNPSTYMFSPKSRKISSTLFEIRELDHIMKIFIAELLKENAMCSDTILGEIAKHVDFKFFHNEFDQHKIIKSSEEIQKFDKRFNASMHEIKAENAKFASDARFLRGCISISKRN